jgi:hypothetical protein
MKKLLVVMVLALVVFGLLPGCRSQQGSGTESPLVGANNPATTEGTAATSSQMNSMNSWIASAVFTVEPPWERFRGYHHA